MVDTPAEFCSCSTLRQAARHMTRFYDEALGPAGIGLNQYAILATIDRSGPRPIQDVARLLVTDRSTIGHLLRPLETRGLVTIAVAPNDRRARIVALTEAGRALLAGAKPRWADAERRFNDTFGASDASTLRALLKRVTTTDLRV
jgi:DNA-binding MarR family transcriptional regulator